MPALSRLRWLLPAIVVPLCVAFVGLGVQAAAFDRPNRETLNAADVLHELFEFRVMRSTEVVDGKRVRAVCIGGLFRQGRHPFIRGSLALLGNGERLYDVGGTVRRAGRRTSSRLDLGRFLLAGCPDIIGNRVASRLEHAKWIDADATRIGRRATFIIAFGRRSSPIDLYVTQRTLRPTRLVLTGKPIRGWSELHPGGGRSVVALVHRAYRKLFRWKDKRA